jgi:hypothetical protein
MQQVITQTQARAVLNGRAPLIPVEYETACKALAECITLDEAKYWDNKADALAAWAKIYHSPDAERKAKQLKLHAFRRMGQLADELRPSSKSRRIGTTGWGGSLPGSRALLIEHGATKSQARAMRDLATMEESKFSRIVELPKPPAPNFASNRYGHGSEAWKAWSLSAMSFRSNLRKQTALAVANGMTPEEKIRAVALVRDIADWLDEFDRCLSARKDAK